MAPLPSLIALRAFEAIGRLGGIRRAAGALGVSHAIVSRHLRSIEELAGLTLFDRQEGRLTHAGVNYHARISGAFAEIGAATVALTSRTDRLVIGCAPGLALLWLTARLARFGDGSAPLIELRALDALPDLANNVVDADIRYSYDQENAERRDIRALAVARPPVFPVASPEVALAIAPRLRSPADLTTLPLIDEADGRDWRLWLTAKGVETRPANVVGRYGHAHLALAAARAGQGIALGNGYLLGDDFTSGRLVPLSSTNLAFAPVPLGAYVFRASKSRWSLPPLARFRRWLLAEFRRDRPVWPSWATPPVTVDP